MPFIAAFKGNGMSDYTLHLDAETFRKVLLCLAYRMPDETKDERIRRKRALDIMFNFSIT